MRKFLFAAAIACLSLFTSCEKVDHTGDETGTLYGVWALDTKTEITTDDEGQEVRNEVDYSDVHFYLSLSEPRIAIAKKGSFTDADLKDVDVDAVTFSYNSDEKKINFDKQLWLSEGLLYHMRLLGTYDVLELTDERFTIQQEVLGIKTIYSYHRFE